MALGTGDDGVPVGDNGEAATATTAPDGVDENCKGESGKGAAATTSSSSSSSSSTLSSRHGFRTDLLVALLLFINIGMVIYSHLGLSLQMFTTVPPDVVAASSEACGRRRRLQSEPEGKCSAADQSKFEQDGAEAGLSALSSKCGGSCGIQVLQGIECVSSCTEKDGYSAECATCMGEQASCVVK